MPEFLGPSQIKKLLTSTLVSQTFLGVDVGSSCVGLAIAQHGTKMAFPLSWFKRRNPLEDARVVHDILIANGVDVCVFGYPLTLQGGEGENCRNVALFVRGLQQQGVFLDTKVHSCLFWDERFSTQMAKRVVLRTRQNLRDLRDPTKDEMKKEVDKYSAAFLLQTVLDRFP
ncbi:Putative pre-16S rRNA nuclease [Galdieria sulphuraria]|uniref:Putative holliday junction resolvase n=1 Tax=Galdieria sulphuraria TaxID=130081 RepID=M2WXB1_GALSU|nr:putative holliday junction resolvase [Galdieria sulphuraria]EME28670.1 putative holliday junction resolvase [Galdieria sulphuraria]GJD10697.1 Putative pre-16S rRNA nuclease [Galdieria sulphuraria]|eukprot:XP_005705190.1 putative holliday junction resolvase [Galdieria sulphuraria]